MTDNYNNNPNQQMPYHPQPGAQGQSAQGGMHGARYAANGQPAQAGQPMQTGQPSSRPQMRTPQGRPIAGNGAPLRPKGSGKRTVLIVLGVLVVAVAIWVLVWMFACSGSDLFDQTAQTGQAPYKSPEEMQAELDRVVDEGMFNISIASVIQFDDGTSAGTAYIENIPGNRYNMQVTITSDDTGDVLYESGVLTPNQFIENITLAQDLEPGSYAATATFTALEDTTFEEVGKAAAKVTINVLG